MDEINGEIRRVPENWEHPREITGNGAGEYVPLIRYEKIDIGNKMFQENLQKWFKEHKEFEEGKKFVIPDDRHGDDVFMKCEGATYTSYTGPPPIVDNPDDFMPNGDWYQLYEKCGVPISPPFETTEELTKWLAEWLIEKKVFEAFEETIGFHQARGK